MKFTVVMKMDYSTKWLKLSRNERNAFNEEHVFPILGKYGKHIEFRFFDSECFAADYSDFAILNVSDMKKFYYFMEELRDSALIAEDYMVVKEYMVGVEDGYLEFENKSPESDHSSV